MEDEWLAIFDEDGTRTGVATREEIHRLGIWHETIHCWFITHEAGVDYIYLQLRSDDKKDYPNLLDITVAGHIMAHETVEDGIREIQEEVGIEVTFDELVPLGIIKYTNTKEEFIDNELAHSFIYASSKTFDEYTLQREEVSGIVRATFQDFYDLWLGINEEIRVEGFIIDENGERLPVDKNVTKDSFVPHEDAYYESVVRKIEVYIRSALKKKNSSSQSNLAKSHQA
ncbi:NUDIX hydrolase [Brevibacillus daliensis]|uniref:NUDIX hydrolase n=1 Tax=Brevibacillus daliensis TaxID=2892995 RepID=UPI001E349C9C|nr:NUDIX domain-containing protein [Brevibacillus daliensis]